ncbi:MAG: hypothetical protein ACRETQ_10350 [Gammaproteobacteria bacterium]
MLKYFVIALGVAGLVAAVVCLAFELFVPAIYLFIEGAVVIVAVLFEPWRYLPKVNRNRGQWQATGERFRDPTSGKLVEVFYNPETGQRDYRDPESPG